MTYGRQDSSKSKFATKPIQQRAYALWQQRSPSDGDAVSDWLRAEAEVLEQCHAALRTDEGSETAEPTRRAKKRTNATRER